MNEGVKAQINDGQIRCVTTQRTAAKEIKVRRQARQEIWHSPSRKTLG